MDGRCLAEAEYTPFRASPISILTRPQLAGCNGFITDRDGETLDLEADHRRHAEIENAIRDLKYGVGLNHLPSGRFAANAALSIQVIAHNLARWTGRIALEEAVATTKTLRRRFSPWPDASPARLGASPCTSPGAGPGNAIRTRLDCAPCRFLPDGAGVQPDPSAGLPNRLAYLPHRFLIVSGCKHDVIVSILTRPTGRVQLPFDSGLGEATTSVE